MIALLVRVARDAGGPVDEAQRSGWRGPQETVIAHSGQLLTAFAASNLSSAGTRSTVTVACPTSSSENTAGQISQHRAWPSQRFGSALTFMRRHLPFEMIRT